MSENTKKSLFSEKSDEAEQFYAENQQTFVYTH